MVTVKKIPVSMYLKNIDVLVNEYNILKEELLQFHRMQQQLSIQTPVVIGALFWVMSWEIANELSFYAMILVVPIYCYATVLSSFGLIIRTRHIRQYLMGQEMKINELLHAVSQNLKQVSYNIEYLSATSGKKGKLYRLDTGPPAFVFFLIPFLSFYLCWVNFHDTKTMTDVFPFLVINIICIILVVALSFKAQKLIHELKNVKKS